MALSREELSSCSFLLCAEKAEYAPTEQRTLFGTVAAVPSPLEGCARCVYWMSFIGKILLCSWLPAESSLAPHAVVSESRVGSLGRQWARHEGWGRFGLACWFLWFWVFSPFSPLAAYNDYVIFCL